MDADALLASGLWDFATSNWALISILATLALLAAVPIVVIRKYLKLISNLFADTPPPLSVHLRDYEHVDGEPVDFRALDGHRLSGILIRGSLTRSPRGMIVFAAEFMSGARSCARYCRPLLDAGYDVFSFDFRGHGNSPGEDGYQPRQWPSDREVADMLGAIAYVEDFLEQAERPTDIGLFGISRGAGTAILAAEGVPSVKAIITDGAFSSDSTLEYFMKRWAKIFAKVRVVYENHPPAFWRFMRWLVFRECSRRYRCNYPSVRKVLGNLDHTPVLMIHGNKDSYIPVSQTQMLFDCADEPKYIWIVPGAKHNQSVAAQPDEYAAKTLNFFDKHLAGITADSGPDCLRPLRRLTQPLPNPLDLNKPKTTTGRKPDRSV